MLYTLDFTALHEMQTRSSNENSVCLSVRQNAWIVTKRKKSVQIFILHERSFIVVFSEKKIVRGGDQFYLEFWVNRFPLEKNRRF